MELRTHNTPATSSGWPAGSGARVPEPPKPHRFTRDEYHNLVESGALGDRPRVELIFGEIVDRSPHNEEHANLVANVTELLIVALGRKFTVRPQLPMALADDREPEPDLCVTPRVNQAGAPHPSVAPLVVEVADSSLSLDRGTKLRMYALADVPEYWIVDVRARAIEVYTEPLGDGYANKRTARLDDHVTATAVPNLTIAVREVFFE